MLSIDEVFDNLDEYHNVFNQSDMDIISVLAEVYGLRNKRQLEYLSVERHSTKQKIKFTLKPMFGFLFFLEGSQSDYYCWELLNSNATYLWKITKTADASHLAVIEQEISCIHEIGREQYRRDIKKTQPVGFVFSFVDHKGIAVNENDSFSEWKQKLNEMTA